METSLAVVVVAASVASTDSFAVLRSRTSVVSSSITVLALPVDDSGPDVGVNIVVVSNTTSVDGCIVNGVGVGDIDFVASVGAHVVANVTIVDLVVASAAANNAIVSPSSSDFKPMLCNSDLATTLMVAVVDAVDVEAVAVDAVVVNAVVEDAVLVDAVDVDALVGGVVVAAVVNCSCVGALAVIGQL